MKLWEKIKGIAKKLANVVVEYIKKTDASTIAKNVIGGVATAVSTAISLKFLYDRFRAFRIMRNAKKQSQQKQASQKAPIDYGLNLGSKTRKVPGLDYDYIDPELEKRLQQDFEMELIKKSPDYRAMDRQSRKIWKKALRETMKEEELDKTSDVVEELMQYYAELERPHTEAREREREREDKELSTPMYQLDFMDRQMYEKAMEICRAGEKAERSKLKKKNKSVF